MGAYVAVVFVQPVEAGFTFPRTAWPLHITLARFDTKESAGTVGSRIGGPLADHLGFAVKIGEDAGFGRGGTVRVSLVQPDARLQALHDGLLDTLGPEVHVLSPQHNRTRFRPHVTHMDTRLHPGDTVHVRQAALVDMRPGGDSRIRTVLAVWTAVRP
ncbi:2'-5' RNA ligase family protein [Arthrobacter sp. I2-34]|uniref:2'-5' RNA ligase family protein n=1 Tax=Arthrobacter hankyongi TaxID=2904801 RepID=A0ABS9LA40_9MICC|nr:2'-5' RNA ligase family protein [Arthrobacter hankyongi]MCG2623558.1 2'-5' RNA ligase family protein [Arthrobacter hankyongi]